MNEREFEDFVYEAQQHLAHLNRRCAHDHGIGNYDRWQYDADDGTMVFHSGDRAIVRARVQVVGTTSERSNTWLWSWANESIPSSQVSSALSVRVFGDEHQLAALTTPELADDEYLGWEMTAITAMLTNACGGYRTSRPSGGFTYYVFLDLHYLDRQ